MKNERAEVGSQRAEDRRQEIGEGAGMAPFFCHARMILSDIHVEKALHNSTSRHFEGAQATEKSFFYIIPDYGLSNGMFGIVSSNLCCKKYMILIYLTCIKYRTGYYLHGKRNNECLGGMEKYVSPQAVVAQRRKAGGEDLHSKGLWPQAVFPLSLPEF